MFKSIKTSVIAVILVSSAIYAQAQKKITEGIANYDVAYDLPAEQAAMASMLPKQQSIKFSGNILRIDMEQGPATIGILQNFVDKQGLMLIDVPVAQIQYAVKMSKEEIEKAEATTPKFSEFKATGEKQKVGDYNAEKYTYKDDKGTTYELWATKDVELPKGFSGQQFTSIDGTLVKYTTFQNGAKMTLTLKSIDDKKVGTLNLEVPSGYELKTMADIMAMQGGGQ